MKQLQDKELEKLSTISGVPVADLQNLHALGVLNPRTVIACLIKYDYKRIRSCGRYSVRQITAAIMQEYQVSKNTVQNAIYEKKKKEFFCSQCGRLVKKAELRRNNGLCDQCTINSIQL